MVTREKTTPADERMSKVDTAWLRMDSSANLMQIVGVWQLAPSVTYAAVCRRIEATLLRHDRFRQRVEQDVAGATWVLDTQFELARHVVRARLPKSLRRHPRRIKPRPGTRKPG